MISEALGLLFGQIAVLSMQRFIKTIPESWIRERIHPLIQHLLRCNLHVNDILENSEQSKDRSVLITNLEEDEEYPRDDTEAKIIIGWIEKVMLKLRNYDLQLVRFEETFLGSLIMLIIILCILLTICLWLRRLSYVLPLEYSKNQAERPIKLINQLDQQLPRKERKVIKSAKPRQLETTTDQCVSQHCQQKQLATTRKHEDRCTSTSTKYPTTDADNQQKECKIELVNSARAIKNKRPRFLPIILFSLDELLNAQQTPSLSMQRLSLNTIRWKNLRYIRIY